MRRTKYLKIREAWRYYWRSLGHRFRSITPHASLPLKKWLDLADLVSRQAGNVLKLQNPRKWYGTMWHVLWNLSLTLWTTQNIFKSENKHFGMQKRPNLALHVQFLAVILICRFYLSAAYVQPEFGERADSIRVRLLIKCRFCARLYGNDICGVQA